MHDRFISPEQTGRRTAIEDESFTRFTQSLNRIESIIANSALTQAQLQTELSEAERLFNDQRNQLTNPSRQEIVESRLFDLKHQVAKRGISEALQAISNHITSGVIKKDYINYWLDLAQRRINEADEFFDADDKQDYQKQLTKVTEIIDTL